MGLELDNKVWEMALAEDIQRKDRWYYDLIFRTVEYKNCRNNWKPLYGERGLITDNWNGALLKFEKSNNSDYSMDIEIESIMKELLSVIFFLNIRMLFTIKS